ncbi:MAG: hypothetical protein AB1801_17300 [Chloroflexota bacterium]
MSRSYPLFRFLALFSKARVWLILTICLLPAIACGLSNPQYRLNNQVRQAVYDYERREGGPVDDLVISFKREEPRTKFLGQNEQGGRTIWLENLGAGEYFALRSPQTTYLYLQAIDFSDDRATARVTVYRGDGRGYTGRWLTLTQAGTGQWAVTGDAPIPDNASGSTTSDP